MKNLMIKISLLFLVLCITNAYATIARADICTDSVNTPGSALYYLKNTAFQDSLTNDYLTSALVYTADLPSYYPESKNPWAVADLDALKAKMITFFTEWCSFLPEIQGSEDNGLRYIQEFAWFYYKNLFAVRWVQGKAPASAKPPPLTGIRFLKMFNKLRGQYMRSPDSKTHIDQWIQDPRIEIDDYKKTQVAEFSSWNDFFTREIKTYKSDPNSHVLNRPVTMPVMRPEADQAYLPSNVKRDYIIVSPTDCIMNSLVQQFVNKVGEVTTAFIDNPLQQNMVLDIKGFPISMSAMLEGVDADITDKFVGGTGLSCVLLPNTYHHYHSPVTGNVIHAAVLKSPVDEATYNPFGYIDWPNWVPDNGNVGRPGTDFGRFIPFQRGVIIIEVKYCDEKGAQSPGVCVGSQLTGYVASIPVGLDTIGSVELDEYITKASKSNPIPVEAGRHRFGHFNYGGSLNILLFSKGLASGVVRTRLGSQIGMYSVGTPPKVRD